MWDMHDVGAGWWIVTSVGMIAFWALIIWGIVAVARGGLPGARRNDSAALQIEAPMDVLKRRLASGEITLDEYERLRDTISNGKGRAAPTVGASGGSPRPG